MHFHLDILTYWFTRTRFGTYHQRFSFQQLCQFFIVSPQNCSWNVRGWAKKVSIDDQRKKDGGWCLLWDEWVVHSSGDMFSQIFVAQENTERSHLECDLSSISYRGILIIITSSSTNANITTHTRPEKYRIASNDGHEISSSHTTKNQFEIGKSGKQFQSSRDARAWAREHVIYQPYF